MLMIRTSDETNAATIKKCFYKLTQPSLPHVVSFALIDISMTAIEILSAAEREVVAGIGAFVCNVG